MSSRKITIQKYKRSSYKRRAPGGKRKTITVRATTVRKHRRKDLGKPGKGPKTLPPIRKNELPGYHVKNAPDTRRKNLRKIAKTTAKTLKVARALQLRANYTSQSQPANSRKYKADARYMLNRYHSMKK